MRNDQAYEGQLYPGSSQKRPPKHSPSQKPSQPEGESQYAPQMLKPPSYAVVTEEISGRRSARHRGSPDSKLHAVATDTKSAAAGDQRQHEMVDLYDRRSYEGTLKQQTAHRSAHHNKNVLKAGHEGDNSIWKID